MAASSTVTSAPLVAAGDLTQGAAAATPTDGMGCGSVPVGQVAIECYPLGVGRRSEDIPLETPGRSLFGCPERLSVVHGIHPLAGRVHI